MTLVLHTRLQKRFANARRTGPELAFSPLSSSLRRSTAPRHATPRHTTPHRVVVVWDRFLLRCSFSRGARNKRIRYEFASPLLLTFLFSPGTAFVLPLRSILRSVPWYCLATQTRHRGYTCQFFVHHVRKPPRTTTPRVSFAFRSFAFLFSARAVIILALF